MLKKINYRKFLWPVVIGLVLWFLAPLRPAALSIAAWRMFAIFVATIVGCITQPLPIGAVAIIGFVAATLTGIVDINTAVAGFGNSSIWLIAMAFFISRGFIKTGLGRRIALKFVQLFGKRTLTLAYSIIGVDLVLAPATPSNTARAGGVIYPIIQSLAQTFDSDPKKGTERKIGSFLVFSEFHGDAITSAMFLTAMAANPLAQTFAAAKQIDLSWMTWFLAALVPGIISLILIPLIIYKMYPPEIKETPNAKKWADQELQQMGRVSTAEKIMSLIFLIALLLWVTGTVTGIDATLTAFIALGLLLLTGVLEWQDVLHETGAWNTLTWFSVLVMMATELNKLGFIPWLSKTIAGELKGFSWFVVLVILIITYFYSHYLFASSTAHVSAMYAAMLGVALAAGVPGTLAALMLGFFGNLFASTTHYSSGPAPIYFGSGYVKQTDWWRMNFILGLVYIVLWLSIGTIWTKILGIW
ncbi:MAG: anion permease [Liquorilactobacillus nagelii]|jgi:DASS family divalent anion:Na+ symporter|uniref:Anion permease n=2 Tax=Liquorilactobacillus nagelii TaxID=82688 RepID=A0A3S6QU59_9LACO|nr:anion permease [Liquorilactobacillus nagelii]AUJ31662.1 anion permease [Liquorilactobacillus nagelii]MCC7615973.1 anion permease [Liquorilactobacillus nagelii]MCI1633140.1 anion permease [Liquorilactobacillus nagelii]MCI1700867.1 anion permease [Liquorilactobacillus nagelii]MCI1921023.1 anion permease [Liquorilactobacillus nagelii]